MSYFYQTNFKGDNNIGLYGIATDDFCLLGFENKEINKKIKDALKVDIYNFRFIGLNIIKILCAGNSSGIVLPEIIPDYEAKEFRKIFDKKVKIVKSNYAIGNFILMNDKGIVISPEIKKVKEEVENFFGLDSKISTIAKLSIIGSLAIATNKGCLLHPDVSEKEADTIKSALDVEVNIGTVNFGNPYPTSGIIANANGFVVSKTTSGSELGRITETLGFLS